MSFGGSPSDVILLARIAWNTFQNTRKAAGEHDELAQEAKCLHIVLSRLKREYEHPESPLNRPDDKSQEELRPIMTGCYRELRRLDDFLNEYSILSRKERGGKRLWRSLRFGSKREFLQDLRDKLSWYTDQMDFFLNIVSSRAIGRVELNVQDLQHTVRGIARSMPRAPQDETVLSDHSDDDKNVWKCFRTNLINDAIKSSFIEQHEDVIHAHIKGLSYRDVLGEKIWHEGRSHVHAEEIYDRNGYACNIHRHQMRVQSLDSGPQYDGNLGLGSILSVDSTSNVPLEAAKRTIRGEFYGDETDSEDEASVHSDSSYSSTRSNISRQDMPCPEAYNSTLTPRTFDGHRRRSVGGQLVLRDTELPLTVANGRFEPQQRVNNHLQNGRRQVTRSHTMSLQRTPTTYQSQNSLPRRRTYSVERTRDQFDLEEKTKKKKKGMTTVFLGTIVVYIACLI